MAGTATVKPLHMTRSQTEGQLYRCHSDMYLSQPTPKKKKKKKVTISDNPATVTVFINNNPTDYSDEDFEVRRSRSQSVPIIIRAPTMEDRDTLPEPKLPQTYFTLAGLVTLCFNCPIGFIAVLFSKSAINNFKNGNISKGKLQARVALVLSMIGVIITMGIVIIVVIIALRQKVT